MAKPILVILPGWGGTHETWRDFIAAAKTSGPETRCIDLPCFGDAPCPPHVWGVDEYARYVRDQLDVIKTAEPDAQIHLLGHSFGGQVAVVVAAKYGEYISSLILSGAAVFRPKQVLHRAVFGLIAKVGKLVFRLPLLERFSDTAKKVLYRGAESPDYAATSGIKRDIFKKIIREDVSLYLPGIRLNTLVLWGSHDTYVPLSLGKRIASALPKSQLVIIPKAGHGLHISNIPRMLHSIRTFLGL